MAWTLAATALAWSAGLWLTAPAAGAGGSSHPDLLLDGQSEWVTPPSAGAPAAFDLDLAARGAPASAQVEVVLYPRLDSRDHFEDVVEHGPRNGPLSEASPVRLAQLPADPRTSGGVDLDLQVVTARSTGGGQRLGLDCSGPTSTSTCTGVYPLTVSLLDPSGAVLHRFTTFLTFTASPSAAPLYFALVVPLSAPVSVATEASSPASALVPLGRSEVGTLVQLVDALHAAPSVPVTVDASPETLEALWTSGATGRSAVTTLAGLSANPSVDEVPDAPYVPVDLGALAGAGESTEIKGQMAAGGTVLHKLRVQTPAALPWIATAPVGKGLGSGLSQVGATQVVVQDTSLAPTPTAPSDTWASTFHLNLGTGPGGPLEAAETDSFLDGQFRRAGVDPALAASQVLADLAMVHFERPYTTADRGLVAVPPAAWTPSPAFLRTLLAGLDDNPVVTPVTLSRFFSSVTQAGTRTLQPSGGGGATFSRSLARSLSAARVRLSEFTQTVEGKPAVLGQLDHLLLATESDQLTNPSRADAVAAFDRVFAKQLKYVSFATPGTFTLTARTGVIPITVVSHAPYTIVGTVTVSGAKFQFPGRTTEATHVMVLDHVTNAWRVSVTARSSGDLPLHLRFTSRSGGLVIATSSLTVRSTATSLVGILLTVLAVAVLLAWWARTWRTKRRRRRQPEERVAEADHLAGVP